MNIKLLIAMHKEYRVPKDDLYLPIHVGAAGKEILKAGDNLIQRDDEGDNISEKNPYYCELTALYWAWKNLDAEAYGLVHYRRYFSNKGFIYRISHSPWGSILTNDETQSLMKNHDIIVPAKRNYVIETLYSHYAHTHDKAHLDKTLEIVREYYPDLAQYVEEAYVSRSGHMFNMCIMRRRYFNQYCGFLFDVLGKLEPEVNLEGLSAFDARLFGRVSEILFNAWINYMTEENARIKTIPYVHMEKVDWRRKGKNFLMAKYAGHKYTHSM